MTVGTRPVWYRSLYWRIAFGFVALLAVVLVLQVILFLWLTDRIVGPSSKSPQQLATNLAAEIAPDLAADPSLALDPYLRDKFGHIYQPFLVVLQDGRFGSNRFDRLPPGFARAVLPRARRGGRFGDPGRGGEPWRGGDGGRGGGGFDGRGGPPEPGPPPDSRGPRPDRAGPPAGPPPGPRTDRGPDPRMGDRPPDPDGRGGRRRTAVRVGSDPCGCRGSRAGDRSGRSAACVRRGPGDGAHSGVVRSRTARRRRRRHGPRDLQADAQPAAGARARRPRRSARVRQRSVL